MNLENLKHLSILYVDDDEILRNSTQNILSTLFENVFVAKDGEEAIEIYNKSHIHILMLDIKMKNMSGIDVAKYIRAIDSKIPIFLVSSYTDVEDVLEAIKLDLVDYIKKPFSFEELLNTLIRCLSRIDSKYLIKNNLGENAFYDFLSKQLISNGEYITLTKSEIDVIEIFLQRRNKLISYVEFAHILGENISEVALKNIIYKLRKKIGNNSIQNLSKIGYILN
ncbi:response regulator transcription factor [Aliarcobacter vitoriensis]|uniref:Transcriptional regulator n=1 Tax=Aliarcobacter vitoriensis TaxID=2011099 RepID=A0A366MRF3_9BACT|nr:response regulator transcription factor [Aliarcobacter vitoriensis]RBQ28174.1 transcriptional regulator [Aliarcobacter vitoriensis]